MRKASSSFWVMGALALGIVALAGCNSKDAEPGASGTSKSGLGDVQDPAFLQLIPADTPYVFASFQPVPKDITNAMLAKLAPLVGQSVAVIEAELNKVAADAPAAGSGQPAGAASIKVLQALLEEFKAAEYTEQGLAKLGLGIQANYAIYGIGLLPAFRLELKDPAAFLALLERVQTKAGTQLPKQKLGEQEYWSFVVDEITVALAVVGQELVGTVGTPTALPNVLPLLFGQQKPEKSLADGGTLRQVMAGYGFKPYGVGYLDLRTIAATLLGDAKGLNAAVLAALQIELPPVSPECKAELGGLLDNAPRIVVGYDDLSATSMAASVIFETKPEHLKELAALRAAVPGLGARPAGTPLAAIGIGLDVQKAVDYLKAKALAIQAAPYKCEHLAGLNAAAQELASNLQQASLPPFVTTLKGFNVVVQQADVMPGAPPGDIKAMGVLSTENPMMLVGMAQGIIPDLAKLQVKPDGTPVALPPIGAAPMLKDAFVAVKENLLGLSLGQGMSAEMTKLIEQKAAATQPLLAVSYDSSALMDKVGKMTAGLAEAMPPEAKAEMERSMAMNTAVSKVLGLTSYTLEIGDKGLVLRQSVELK